MTQVQLLALCVCTELPGQLPLPPPTGMLWYLCPRLKQLDDKCNAAVTVLLMSSDLATAEFVLLNLDFSFFWVWAPWVGLFGYLLH